MARNLSGVCQARSKRVRTVSIVLAAICALLLAGEWYARSALGLGDPPLSITHPRIEYLYLADVLQRELSPLMSAGRP